MNLMNQNLDIQEKELMLMYEIVNINNLYFEYKNHLNNNRWVYNHVSNDG